MLDTLLVGYDGSAFGRRALQRVADVAAPRARVSVVTVAPERSSPGDLAERKRCLDEAASLLAETDLEVVTVEGEGDVANALIAAASDSGAQLLIVGSRGRGAVAGLVLGSVSAEIARRAPCDVMVVR